MMDNDLLVELKRFLGITDSDPETDQLLMDIIYMAESFIYQYYGVAIFNRTETEILKAVYGVNILYTRRGLISNLVALSIDGEDITDFTDFFYERNKILVPDTITIQENNRVLCTYQIGYNDILLIPQGILLGLMIICKKIYLDRDKNTDMYTQMSTGVRESVKFVDEIPVVADSVLSTYKVFRL